MDTTGGVQQGNRQGEGLLHPLPGLDGGDDSHGCQLHAALRRGDGSFIGNELP